MKLFNRKSKDFKKIRIGTKIKKKKLKRTIESIEINQNFILFLKIIFFTYLIYKDFSFYDRVKIPPKVSNEIFKEILSFIQEHKNISLEEVEEFRQYSRDKKFIEPNPKFIKSENPLISVIITMHNQAHILHKSIKSVQNQSFKNIEIIIVDDCSRDNTTEEIIEYQKIDPRIVLITHDMNGGSIKSRADGVRAAKGKYITIIDGDDALAHKDILNHSFYVAEKGNIDVIEFQAASFKNKKFRAVVNNYSKINLTNIIYQPELKTKFFIISDNEGIRAIQSRCIYAKLVKNEVFKQALVFIGKKYTDDFITNYEDVIMAVAIHQVSNSYYYMKELGYYYSRGQPGSEMKLKEKKCKPNPSKIKDMGHMKLLHYLMDKFGKTEFGKQLIYHELISINHYLSIVVFTNHHYKYVYEVLDNILDCPYLSNRQRTRIMNIKRKIENKQNRIK